MKITNSIFSIGTFIAISISSCSGSLTNDTHSEESHITTEVQIGKQVWMTQNLNVETFRNGESIPEANSVEEWNDAKWKKTPACCCYNFNPDNCDRYGKLYNWYAVNDPRGLAPDGFKIPTEEDWDQLIDYLGGPSIAGKKMKSTELWSEFNGENGNGTNESGFSCLPSGECNWGGESVNLGLNGNFWCSHEEMVIQAWSRQLSWKSNNVTRKFHNKEVGLSVRCLKN